MRPLFTFLFAVVIWSASSSVSWARPDHLAYDTALRVGPGLSYPPIGTISAGTLVHLVRRDPVWSIVSYDGETGYLLSNHLVGSPNVQPGLPPGLYSWGSGGTLVQTVDPIPAGPFSYYFAGRLGYYGLGATRFWPAR